MMPQSRMLASTVLGSPAAGLLSSLGQHCHQQIGQTTSLAFSRPGVVSLSTSRRSLAPRSSLSLASACAARYPRPPKTTFLPSALATPSPGGHTISVHSTSPFTLLARGNGAKSSPASCRPRARAAEAKTGKEDSEADVGIAQHLLTESLQVGSNIQKTYVESIGTPIVPLSDAQLDKLYFHVHFLILLIFATIVGPIGALKKHFQDKMEKKRSYQDQMELLSTECSLIELMLVGTLQDIPPKLDCLAEKIMKQQVSGGKEGVVYRGSAMFALLICLVLLSYWAPTLLPIFWVKGSEVMIGLLENHISVASLLEFVEKLCISFTGLSLLFMVEVRGEHEDGAWLVEQQRDVLAFVRNFSKGI